MSATSIAWVMQEMPNFDYTTAEKFGVVEFLSAIDYSPMKNSIQNTMINDEIDGKLKRFNPLADYIIPTGSPVLMGAVFMKLALLGHREIVILKWSNRDRSYTPVTIKV